VLADDLVEIMPPGQLGAEERNLALERPSFERPAREGQELVLLEGLGQVIEGAELHGRHGSPHRLHGRDEDYLDPFVERLDALEHFDPVHPGHPDVEQYEVHLGSTDDIERARAVRNVDHVVVVLEDQPERLPDSGVVVNDENRGPRHSRTLAPIPSAQASGPAQPRTSVMSLRSKTADVLHHAGTLDEGRDGARQVNAFVLLTRPPADRVRPPTMVSNPRH
jgi:hypothetical protein